MHEVSAVIVSDEAGDQRDWQAEYKAAMALARQTGVRVKEIIVVENSAYEQSYQPAMFAGIDGFKVVFDQAIDSAALKDIGIQKATCELTFVQEADVILMPDGLRYLCESIAGSGAIAASPRTVYDPENSWLRVLSFIGRERNAGAISNNAALFKTKIIKEYPYSLSGSPFVSCATRTTRILKDGHKALVEEHALAVHDFEGLEFELEYYRQKGFQRMKTNKKQSLKEIPSLLVQEANWIAEWIRSRGSKRLSWREEVMAYGLVAPICIAHIPGMMDACKNTDNTGQRFR